MDYAKWIVAIVALLNFGGLVVDAFIPFTARQHLYNPRWPPHAKFHNGQTMLLGVGLGSTVLFLLFGWHPLTLPIFYLAVVLSSLYFVSMLFIVPLFPGTAWHDPEFDAENPRLLGLYFQKMMAIILSSLLVVASIVAYYVR